MGSGSSTSHNFPAAYFSGFVGGCGCVCVCMHAPDLCNISEILSNPPGLL